MKRNIHGDKVGIIRKDVLEVTRQQDQNEVPGQTTLDNYVGYIICRCNLDGSSTNKDIFCNTK